VGEMAADGAQYLGPLLDEKASRQNILARLDDVARQSRKEDSFVWFMSSHGTLDERGGFGIVPSNIDGEMTKLITSADILAKVKSIKAMTQLLIFDTCHSGALDMQLSGLYDARISRLGKNMGLHLFASAQATEAASDSDGQGHGLFTGQLLAALSDGAADADRNGLLSIKEMGKFAQTKTMERSLRSGSIRGARPVPVDVDGDLVPQRPLMLHFGVDRNLTPSAR
jgi:uncharacterized caspase-like protein